MADDKAQGTADEVKGRAREAFGDLTDNDDQKTQGQAEQAQGKGEKVVGDVKDTIKDATGNS